MAVNSRALKAFISENCANYFSSDPGYRPAEWCEGRQKLCAVLQGGARCKYFEEGVLPIDPDMTGLYVEISSSPPERIGNEVSIEQQKPHRRATRPRKRDGSIKQVAAHGVGK